MSAINALRREGAEALVNAITGKKEIKIGEKNIKKCKEKPQKRNVGRFYSPEQITESAHKFFDVITLPLDKFAYKGDCANGFVMPAVIFDSEESRVEKMLETAAVLKPEFAIVSNLGQIALVKKHMPEIKLIADFRFNIGNSQSAAFFEENGFESYVASAELTLPQLRDLKGARAAIVYGRVPLMTLEKCVIKELYGDRRACDTCAGGKAEMKDRKGFVFPIIREMEHRNIVLNSLPTSMSDRQDELARAGITDRHFLFYTESAYEVDSVIESYQNSLVPSGKVRRI
jgi:hypothetical protein